MRYFALLFLLTLGFGTAAAQTVLINEINYNSAPGFNPEDWLELHNPGTEAADLSGWIFSDSDDNDQFILPAGTMLPAGGYLVLCRDGAAFTARYLGLACMGDFGFALSNGGELVRLLDATGAVVDSLTYDDAAPWPLAPDGTGPTLELKSPDLDNALPDSWQASLAIGGTPGLANENTVPPVVVLNEINYNSADTFDPRDWVELHNPGLDPVDVSGWIFKDADSDTTFVLPAALQIPAQGFLVLCRDDAAFQAVFAAGPACTGPFGFSLSNGGEKLQLWDAARVVVDSLTYDDMDPWPTEPDGTGPTLELRNPALDNTPAANWAASALLGGTPGAVNSTSVLAAEEEVPTGTFRLNPNYPNPFHETTQIGYALERPAEVDLRIYNASGGRVADVHIGRRPAGSYTFTWTPQALSAGLYFYQLVVDGRVVQTRPALLMP